MNENIAAYPLVSFLHALTPLRQMQACATTGDISFALKYLANDKPSKNEHKARFNNFRQRMLHNYVSKKFRKAA